MGHVEEGSTCGMGKDAASAVAEVLARWSDGRQQ